MNRLITSVLFGLVTIQTVIQADPTRPRLVVGIVVDQLRTDYIEYLQTYFGQHGFRKLMERGAYFRDVDFQTRHLDAQSATAMLLTGAYPRATGVPSAMVYDASLRQPRPALHDGKGGSTPVADGYTPSGLKLSTVADELAVDDGGRGTVVSIAADPQQAVALAGHAATSAAWISPLTGDWTTTSYYKELPPALARRNAEAPLRQRIDTIRWEPSRSMGSYPGVPAEKRGAPFKYVYSKKNNPEAYTMLAAGAMANREVTDAAIDCLKELGSGKSGATDMLNLGYSVAPYRYAKGDPRAETIDMYYRLDAQLARLFEAIDRYVGLDNTLVWLSGTGYYDDAHADDVKYRIPGGEFSTKRAKSLLNAYFTAKYGNGEYVESVYGGHVYLNHAQIEGRNLESEKLALEASVFLSKMSGVADAYTLADILSPSTDEERSLRLSVDPSQSGDVVMSFSPGWTVTDDLRNPPVSKTVRSSMVLTPAFILSRAVNAETVTVPVEAVQLAPTLSGILRIRAPNGSYAKPVM